VAAPVRHATGCVIAAVSVVGPVSRARQTLPRYRAAVIGATAVVSARIGYRSGQDR
jgi:DNA-binding IclR family transcriptional regulator